MEPRFYGLAWRDYLRVQAVCMPIPLNIAARIVYLIYQWARHPFREWELLATGEEGGAR